MTVLKGKDINEKNILTDKLPLATILSLNQVFSMDELLQKDRVITCKK
jgi:hypothetical protein